MKLYAHTVVSYSIHSNQERLPLSYSNQIKYLEKIQDLNSKYKECNVVF